MICAFICRQPQPHATLKRCCLDVAVTSKWRRMCWRFVQGPHDKHGWSS